MKVFPDYWFIFLEHLALVQYHSVNSEYKHLIGSKTKAMKKKLIFN